MKRDQNKEFKGKTLYLWGTKGIRGYCCRSGVNDYKKQEYVCSGAYSGICPGGA